MQERPVCFVCHEAIETNAEMVFEAPCGTSTCPSVVFHAICLFDWRDHRRTMEERFEQMRAQWFAEHGDHHAEE